MIKQKGFSLIELLVVVAIIGILAAVGVVAYNGYTAAAKVNSTKTIHAQAVKYISAEAQKCSLDPSGTYMGSLKCSSRSADNMVQGAVDTMKDKNPHNVSNPAVQKGTSHQLGYVSLEASNDDVVLRTCIAKECDDAANKLDATITVE